MTFDARRKPGGWVVGEKLGSAQMNAIDIDLGNAVDKTGDSVTGTIDFEGGGTLYIGDEGNFIITGPDGYGALTDGGTWVFGNGSDTTIAGAATFTVQDGAAISMAGDLTIENAGTLTFAGSDDWPVLASRTVSFSMPAQVIGTTLEGGTGNGNVVAYPSAKADAPGIITQSLTASGEWFRLALPLGPKNSTLDTVSIWAQGYSSSVSVTLPTYRVQSLNISNVSLPAITNVSSAQTDAHASDGSDWTDWVETTITVDSPLFSPDGRVYWVLVTAPYSAAGSGLYVCNVTATYTVTELRY